MPKPSIPLSRFKEHLVIDHDLQDATLGLYLGAAVDVCLAKIGLAGELEAPRTDTITAQESIFPLPLHALTSVSKNGTPLTSGQYTLTGNHETKHRIRIADAQWDPVATYTILWEPGFTPLPDWFTIATLFLATHYHENRSAVAVGQGISSIELPLSVENILSPHRRFWFL
jgi:hypothetical protein